MTLTLKISPKVKIFETYQLRKTCQNMLGCYAQTIIYCWRRFALYEPLVLFYFVYLFIYFFFSRKQSPSGTLPDRKSVRFLWRNFLFLSRLNYLRKKICSVVKLVHNNFESRKHDWNSAKARVFFMD